MSELRNSTGHGLSEMDKKKYDSMSTDELREIMRKDAEMPDSGKSDIDAILYVMEVVAQREKESGEAPDVDAAWESFNKNYLPSSDNSHTSDDDPDTKARILSEDADTRPSVSSRPRSSIAKRWLRGAAGVALVSVLAVSVNFVSTKAFEFDIFERVALWTQETFGFFFPGSKTADNQLIVLQRYLEGFGAADNVIPKYIPEGYEMSETVFNTTNSQITVCCSLSNGDNEIMLQYHIYPTERNTRTYETNSEDPDIHKKGGIDHYIMSNMNKYTAAWKSGNTECSIFGVSSRKELIKMINSIYGG